MLFIFISVELSLCSWDHGMESRRFSLKFVELSLMSCDCVYRVDCVTMDKSHVSSFFLWAAVLRRWRARVLFNTNTPQDKLGQHKHVRLIMFACVWKCKPKIHWNVSSWSALVCFLGRKLFLFGDTSAEPPSLCLKLDCCHLPPFPLSLSALSAILSPRGAQKSHVATGCICEPVTLWASSQAAPCQGFRCVEVPNALLAWNVARKHIVVFTALLHPLQNMIKLTKGK